MQVSALCTVQETVGLANLDNLFVGHSGQEDVLLVFVWIKTNHVGNLAVTEPLDALARFGVPELHLPIITAREEPAPVVREGYVLDSLGMSVEGTKTVPMGIDVPQLQSDE